MKLCLVLSILFALPLAIFADEQNLSKTHIPSLEPDKSSSRLSAGLDKLHTGNTAEAEKLFKSVLEIDPKNTDAYFNLGSIAENRSDLRTALHYYREGLKVSPTDIRLRGAVDRVNAKLGKTTTKKHLSPIAKRVIYTGLRTGVRMAIRRW